VRTVPVSFARARDPKNGDSFPLRDSGPSIAVLAALCMIIPGPKVPAHRMILVCPERMLFLPSARLATWQENSHTFDSELRFGSPGPDLFQVEDFRHRGEFLAGL
jgi:hypothetical protein